MSVPTTVVVSIDGFHHPRAVLDTFPDPKEVHERRDAAFTFDAAEVVALVQQLKTTTPAAVAAPSFDHATKGPVLDDIQIPSEPSLIILEENWL